MATLDTIRQQLTESTKDTTAAPRAGTTERVERIQAGVSGKDLGPLSGPKTSRLAERIALQQAATEKEKQAATGEVISEQLRGAEEAAEQQYTQEQLDLVERGIKVRQQAAQQSEQILNQLARDNRTLDMQRDAAKAEQLGFTLRLNNDKYINQLQTQGAYARLDNELAFEEALQKAIWEDELDLLNQSIELRTLIDEDEAKFIRELSNISLDSALELSKVAISGAAEAAKWQGYSSILKGGLEAGDAYGAGKFESKTPTPSPSEMGDDNG